jgi:hypothetical protein
MVKKRKNKKKHDKPGRPRVNYEFEEAVRRARSENLQSVRDYAKWHEMHKPAKMPKRPDRAYEKQWKGWGYFLGVYNEMPYKGGKRCRPYEDAKAYARKLGFTSTTQWFDHCREGNLPDDIPARPDVYYNKTGEWYTWTEFLGTRIHHRIKYAQESKKYFFIGRYKDVPFNNIYVFGIDNSIYNLNKDNDFVLLKVYEIDVDYDWKGLLEKHGEPYFEKGRSNEYFIKNPGELFYEMSLDLSEVMDIN